MGYPDLVVISGASRGLGDYLCKFLLSEGLSVIGISRSEKSSVSYSNINNQFLRMVQLDISDIAKTNYTIRNLLSYFPKQKIGLILNAATLGIGGGLLDADLYEWQQVFETNLFGNLAVTQAVLPFMLEAKFGRIVFLAGGGSAYNYEKFSAYGLSKVSTVRQSENLAKELESKGDFSVASLAPGAMPTSMLEQVRASGAEVRTVVDFSEPANFIKYFLQTEDKNLNGRFVHSRDDYKNFDGIDKNKWYLRRIE
jgi:NADP-dependent 3-hydroxy acid dehydrogenase YdfG